MDSDLQLDPATMIGLSDTPQGSTDDALNVFEWHPHYQNCQRYFLDYAQHNGHVQALSAFLNIKLPFQRQSYPISNSSTQNLSHSTLYSPPDHPSVSKSSRASTAKPPPYITLIPYLRRLVATGMDFPGVLHGFFGDDWAAGVGVLHEQERRNYLFAAKSGGWVAVKKEYDISPLATVPFLRPLQGPLDSEVEAAEQCWSEWLAMEDWMVGPRAPDVLCDSS